MAWSMLSCGDFKLWHNRGNEEGSCRFPRWWRGTPQRCRRFADGDSSTRTRLAGQPGAIPGSDGSAGCVAQIHGDSNSTAIQHTFAEWVDAGEHVSFAGAAGDDPVVSQAA